MKRSTKRVLFLFSYPNSQLNSHNYDGFTKLISKAAGKSFRGYTSALSLLEFRVVGNEASIYDPVNKRDLKDYDLVFFRMWKKEFERATATAIYLKRHGVKFADREVYATRAFTKLVGYFLMWSVDVPIPDTYFAEVETMLKTLKKDKYFKYPMILKSTEAKKGEDNYLVKNYTELRQILRQNSEVPFVAQNFIPNDGDYRFLVTGNEVNVIIERTRTDDDTHLNNISRGGSGRIVDSAEFNQDVIKHAIKAAQVRNRDIAGVDVIFNRDTGEHYILEVNMVPQIITGACTEEKIQAFTKYLKQILRRKKVVPANREKKMIGRITSVSFPVLGLKGLSAKVDTGAYRGTLHCQHIEVKNEHGKEVLCFIPLDPQHPRFKQKPVKTSNFERAWVRSSTGHNEKRYIVKTPIVIMGKQYSIEISLYDRKSMRNAVLLGRKFLRDKYIIDLEG